VKKYCWTFLVAAAIVGGLSAAPDAFAQAPSLGTAEGFGVLAGSTVTNTGPTIVQGNLGVSPGTEVIGFPPGIVTGTIHIADGVALQAQSDLTTAYNALAGLACDTNLTGQDLGGLTLTAGVYCFDTSAQLTGTLTLDAQGDPNAEFIFQTGSTLTTASNSAVEVINGGSDCNIYWQVGSSATLGTATAFAGNILALTSITVTTGANASGKLLARNGAVTLDSNGIVICSACEPITLSPSTLPNGTINVAYGPEQISATGGTAPYTFEVVAGSLPDGLALSLAGELAGVPLSTGSFTFTVRATDDNDCLGSRVYTIAINAAGCPTIILNPATIPAAIAGQPYGPVTIEASGGQEPYTYAVTAGALPAGLTLSTGGVISGTPTQSGSFTVTITATDDNGCQGSRIYSAVVNCPVIAIAPATLPGATRGLFYNQTITATGGTAPYTFALVSGSLPQGLTLTAAGSLSGIPTMAGSSTFTIQATDAAGCEAARTYTLTVIVGATSDIPALDWLGMALMIVILGTAAVFAINRLG
jgi:hypothetical protein